MRNLSILFAVAFALFANTANASNQTGAFGSENVSTSSEVRVNKSYTGTVDNLVMNGNSVGPIANQVFTLNGNKLTSTMTELGNMPGSISLDITVAIDADGNITAAGGSPAGTLRPLGIPIRLTLTDFSGTVKNGVLDVTCGVVGRFLGINFPASFHFNGQ